MRFIKADPLGSSSRLVWGFLGAFFVSVLGKLLEGSLHNDVWFYALLTVLVTTAFGQSLPTAAYNGLVSGLFFNFFSSQGQVLSFDSAGDVWLEVLFIVVGMAASLLGRWMPKIPVESERDKPDPSEREPSFTWNSRSSNGESPSAPENTWTS